MSLTIPRWGDGSLGSNMIDALQLAHAYLGLGELYEERREWKRWWSAITIFITL
jgi:hypothetical protein